MSALEWQALLLSLKVSLAATLFTLPGGVLLAAWLARGTSRWRWVVEACHSWFNRKIDFVSLPPRGPHAHVQHTGVPVFRVRLVLRHLVLDLHL